MRVERVVYLWEKKQKNMGWKGKEYSCCAGFNDMWGPVNAAWRDTEGAEKRLMLYRVGWMISDI